MREKIKEILSEVVTASQYKNPLSQLIDAVRHKLKINTSLIDYYRYEFYRNGKSWDRKSRYLSKRGSNFYPFQKNPVRYIPIFDNKYIFSTMLDGFGLPHPKMLTTIGPDYEIKTFSQLKNFISKYRQDMVFKLLDGSGGEGIIVLLYDKGRYRTIDGVIYPEAIWEKLHHGGQNLYSYLVEERVEQNEWASKLWPHSLNTLRVITVKTLDNLWNVMYLMMRVGNGKQVDNTGAGGIQLNLDKEGCVIFAYDWTRKQEINAHPLTSVELVGEKIPMYQEIIDLSLQASQKFPFVGTVGWDIGLSKDGPTIIEGNLFYDCVYDQKFGLSPIVPEQIAAKLPSRRWWHRWDKACIHPNVDPWNIKG